MPGVAEQTMAGVRSCDCDTTWGAARWSGAAFQRANVHEPHGPDMPVPAPPNQASVPSAAQLRRVFADLERRGLIAPGALDAGVSFAAALGSAPARS